MPYRSNVTQVQPTIEEEFRLKKTVFLGYTDIGAGGIRALLGITLKKEFHIMHIPELSNNKVACVCPVSMDVREREYSPVQVWNLKYEQFSVILVNTKVRPDQCHHVCAAIVDLCTRSSIDSFIILSALRVDVVTTDSQPIYENTINNTPLTNYPPLPGESRMNDPFLSTLIQMVHVDFVPTCVLTIPAYRACLGPAREEDGSQTIIETFQAVINATTRISFDTEFSLSLIYKGENGENTGSTSMMYS